MTNDWSQEIGCSHDAWGMAAAVGGMADALVWSLQPWLHEDRMSDMTMAIFDMRDSDCRLPEWLLRPGDSAAN